ncbi:MAG: hypothetical protein ACOYOV_07220 [Bacteroidales bacterium]
MRVIIAGLPYFAKILQSDLAGFDPKNKYVFCDTYYSLFDKIRFSMLLPFTDLVISLNGVSDKSGSLELAVKSGKKIFMLWQGTDVLLAKERFNNNTIYSKYINYAIHFSDSLILIDELKEIGIKADLLNFKHIEINQSTIKDYKDISVYTYVPEGKEVFYGLDFMIPLFEMFPEIEFKIIGTHGKSYPKYPNVKFYGWIDKKSYQDISSKTPIFIRLTEHDGYSRSVLEALSAGNEVIWNMKHELCHYVKRDSILVSEKLREVIQLIENRGLTKNINNIQWADENLNIQNIIGKFKEKIEEYI